MVRVITAAGAVFFFACTVPALAQQCMVDSSVPSLTGGDRPPLRCDANGKLIVSSTVTQSGTWTVQPGNTANTTPWLMTVNQGGNSATVSAGGALKVDGSAVTQPVSAASLPLPTGAATAANQPSAAAQGSTTAGQTGLLVQGAVTAAVPAYTAGQTSPASITTAGGLRVATRENRDASCTFSAFGTYAAGDVVGAAGNAAPNTAGYCSLAVFSYPGGSVLLNRIRVTISDPSTAVTIPLTFCLYKRNPATDGHTVTDNAAYAFNAAYYTFQDLINCWDFSPVALVGNNKVTVWETAFVRSVQAYDAAALNLFGALIAGAGFTSNSVASSQNIAVTVSAEN